MGASFKSSKPPVKFPKANQVVMLAEASIFQVERQKDILNSGKIQQRGGKPTIKQNGGWIHSKSTGKMRHERVCVTKETAPDVMVCTVKEKNPKTGKKRNCQIILGNRETYPAELKAQIEKDEAAYNERKKEVTPKIYAARKHSVSVKKTRAKGRR